MLLIYSHKASPRLFYTANLIFHDLLELDYEIISDQQEFLKYEGPKINYSNRRFGDEIFFANHPMIFEEGIHHIRVETIDYHRIPCIFPASQPASLPYDPISAAFYLVSRYEEYLPFRGDTYGRYRAEKSIAYAKNFLHIPVVNHFAIHIRQLLEEKYPQMRFPAKSYQFILTYDIDVAYSILEKGFLRSQAIHLRALLKRDKGFIKLRERVLSGAEPDPYDTYEDQFRLSEKYHVYPIYFFHVGDYGTLDKSNPWTSPRYQSLIRQISSKYPTGIHPSYISNSKYKTLELEIDRLNSITGRPTQKSRQHYIILNFPQTYRHLSEIGMLEDFSMGYPNNLGFRASICTPFHFYDLEREEPTGLKIHSFAAMDATLFHKMGLKSDDALEEVKLIADEVKKVAGTFIFIAHNNLITENSPFRGWRANFEQLIKYAKE
jgi:hypothetical protein